MSAAIEKTPRVLDINKPQKVSYCIPLWLRDEQIRVNTAAVKGRIAAQYTATDEPIAVVCYGPSLSETWEQIRPFKRIITCSGAHQFLVERGIVPTYHCEVDPRIHKMALMGDPHPDVEYLIASACHPDYLKRLVDGGYNVKLWHIYDGADEGLRLLPHGEWALTGGCSVGLRAMALARFLGYRRQHIFGMDGSEGKTGKHAAAHPNQALVSDVVTYNGVEYRTTQGFLEAARQTWHELDDLKDVTATFYGEGLVQAMAKDYVRSPTVTGKEAVIGYNKPELISDAYREQNAQLHRENLAYGVGAGRHADVIKKLVATMKTPDSLPVSVLDYGCGKSYLQKALGFPIYEYDPAIVGKEESPRPADLVCCLDVLEHIEPEHLTFVLDDLRRCTKQMGYFVINTGPAAKKLPDGRNTHLIQQGEAWWCDRLSAFFVIAKAWPVGKEVHVLVSSRPKAVMRAPMTLGGAKWRTTPYQIGVASEVMPRELYAELCGSFPDVALGKRFGLAEALTKASLSEVNFPEAYIAFVNRTPAWKTFHEYVKHPAFIEKIRGIIKARGVELPSTGLTSRFEFSWLPANGGLLKPHTDIPCKLVTLVMSMRPLDDAEWQDAWGGGTDVLKPRSGVMPVLEDYKAPRDAFDLVETFPYVANQCVIFIKTDNSWHSVGPLAGPAGRWRNTVTINIERNG